MFSLQLEIKKRVEEVRMIKQMQERQKEEEDELRSEIEREEKRRMAQQEIARFRQRVYSSDSNSN